MLDLAVYDSGYLPTVPVLHLARARSTRYIAGVCHDFLNRLLEAIVTRFPVYRCPDVINKDKPAW